MLAPTSHLLRKYESRRNFVVEILTYMEYVPVSALRPPSLTAARYKSSHPLSRRNSDFVVARAGRSLGAFLRGLAHQ